MGRLPPLDDDGGDQAPPALAGTAERQVGAVVDDHRSEIGRVAAGGRGEHCQGDHADHGDDDQQPEREGDPDSSSDQTRRAQDVLRARASPIRTTV